MRPDWTSAHAAWSNVTLILGCGAASAVLTIAWPAYARLFLNRVRSHGEVLQYAQATFLERQLFRTRSRNGILLCASLFERRVEHHRRRRLSRSVRRARLGDGDRCDDAIARRRAPRGRDALLRGLDRLEELLRGKGFIGPAADNELVNRPIDQAGAA